jgi:hypothetical protein
MLRTVARTRAGSSDAGRDLGGLGHAAVDEVVPASLVHLDRKNSRSLADRPQELLERALPRR